MSEERFARFKNKTWNQDRNATTIELRKSKRNDVLATARRLQVSPQMHSSVEPFDTVLRPSLEPFGVDREDTILRPSESVSSWSWPVPTDAPDVLYRLRVASSEMDDTEIYALDKVGWLDSLIAMARNPSEVVQDHALWVLDNAVCLDDDVFIESLVDRGIINAFAEVIMDDTSSENAVESGLWGLANVLGSKSYDLVHRVVHEPKVMDAIFKLWCHPIDNVDLIRSAAMCLWNMLRSKRTTDERNKTLPEPFCRQVALALSEGLTRTVFTRVPLGMRSSDKETLLCAANNALSGIREYLTVYASNPTTPVDAQLVMSLVQPALSVLRDPVAWMMEADGTLRENLVRWALFCIHPVVTARAVPGLIRLDSNELYAPNTNRIVQTQGGYVSIVQAMAIDHGLLVGLVTALQWLTDNAFSDVMRQLIMTIGSVAVEVPNDAFDALRLVSDIARRQESCRVRRECFHALERGSYLLPLRQFLIDVCELPRLACQEMVLRGDTLFKAAAYLERETRDNRKLLEEATAVDRWVVTVDMLSVSTSNEAITRLADMITELEDEI